MIALVALPGATKEKIDLRVTEDSLYVDAKANPREGRYLRRETMPMAMRREIKLPVEVKPEQVKASFSDGILEVRLPKLVVSKCPEGSGSIRDLLVRSFSCRCRHYFSGHMGRRNKEVEKSSSRFFSPCYLGFPW